MYKVASTAELHRAFEASCLTYWQLIGRVGLGFTYPCVAAGCLAAYDVAVHTDQSVCEMAGQRYRVLVTGEDIEELKIVRVTNKEVLLENLICLFLLLESLLI